MVFTAGKLADDLAKLHTDFDDGLLRNSSGTQIPGFIEYQTIDPDEDDPEFPPHVTVNKLVYRSHQKLAVNATVSSGPTNWKVTSIVGDEMAWQHRLTKV